MAGTKISRALDKIAVKSEPGLTTAQLMLTNEDLKPGMLLYLLIQTPS
jgi:NCS1 family nucleobase:cation symporter-1